MTDRKKKHIQSLQLSLFIVCLAFFPIVVSNAYYVSIMIFIGLFSLITIGLGLLMGYTGQISVGHAAFFGVGAYTSGYLTSHLNLNPWAAMGMGIVITSALALVIGIPSLKLKGNYLAMATLGFGVIMHILFSELTITGGASGISNIPQLKIGGLLFNTDIKIYILVWCFVILIFVFSLNFLRSRVGRALRSIRENEMAASSIGISVAKYKIQIFMLSAIYASLAGSLYAHFVTYVSPSSFSLWTAVTFVTMIVVGGMFNLWGAILGTALLTILQEALRKFGEFDVVLYGLALILVMIFMPEGLLSGLENLWKRVRMESRK